MRNLIHSMMISAIHECPSAMKHDSVTCPKCLPIYYAIRNCVKEVVLEIQGVNFPIQEDDAGDTHEVSAEQTRRAVSRYCAELLKEIK